jgi:hypothetical protein
MTTDSTACGFAAPGNCGTTFGPNSGLHYVIGMPTPTMPTTGSATYSLIGATAPTDGTNVGTFTGSLGITFGATHTITGNFNVAIASANYNWSMSTTSSNSLFSGTTTIPTIFSSPACSCACNIGVSGFFAGASAERAGIAYKIQDVGVRDIFGAAAFKKN